MARTNVYIDGFNFYNGAVRHTPYKWLNIGALCQALLPGHTIHRIRYFTASVRAFPHDPQAPTRQEVFLRALRTVPNLTVHKDGWFTSHAVLLPQFPFAYRRPGAPPQFVQVQKMEEKRTDVDIASRLLIDTFDGDFDEAVVISNDSDLCLPVETVRVKFGKPITVINPHPAKSQSGQLRKAASSHVRTINKSVLARCQFPPKMTDANGTIAKPASW